MRNFITRFQRAFVLTLATTLVAPALAEDGGDAFAPPADMSSEMGSDVPSAPADGYTGGSLEAEPDVVAEPAPVKKKKAKKVAKKKGKNKKKVAKKGAKKKGAKKKNNRRG